MLNTYRPSGRFDPTVVLLLPLVAAVGAGAAWVYQRLVDWIPLIYVNFLVTLGFGIGLGALTAWALRRGKVRNAALATAAAVVVVLAADAASFYWAWRIHLPQLHEEIAEVARTQGDEVVPYEEFAEAVTFDVWLQARVESGWQVGRLSSSSSGPPLSGLFVYAIWAIEAAVLLACALKSARAVPRTPFCETCDAWTTGSALAPLRTVDAEALRSAARSGDARTLLAPRPAGGSEETATYVVRECASCRNGGFVDVSVSRPVRTAKGKVEVKTDVLVPGLVLSSAERDALRAHRYAEPAAT